MATLTVKHASVQKPFESELNMDNTNHASAVTVHSAIGYGLAVLRHNTCVLKHGLFLHCTVGKQSQDGSAFLSTQSQ